VLSGRNTTGRNTIGGREEGEWTNREKREQAEKVPRDAGVYE